MKKFVRFLIALLGLGIGVGIVSLVIYNFSFPGYSPYVMRYTTNTGGLIAVYVGVGFVCGIAAYSVAPALMDRTAGLARRIRAYFGALPAIDVVFGIAGALVGMLLAMLLSRLLANIPLRPVYLILSVLLYVALGIGGWSFASRHRAEIMSGSKQAHGGVPPKVLDTSAIIDGRILDVCETGFVDGSIVIPEFVLRELRHIADSSEQARRGRGRRGLDVIKGLQEKLGDRVVIDGTDFPKVPEVDLKLLELARKLGGVLVTNDYNLNKVAAVQSITVLNINDLAKALKPVVLPGEEMTVGIQREGKEAGQGIGYLEDGTMVIVEGGKRLIGQEACVQVTSSLQTSAGRMIFAKPVTK